MRSATCSSIGILFGLLVIGCGLSGLGSEEDGATTSTENSSEEAIVTLERDFGGPAGLMDFFATSTEEELRAAFEAYGIGFDVQTLAITDCPKKFPSTDRNKWHSVAQLGGYGKRANLVPQDLNFNRGNWAVLENKMTDCAGLPNGRFRYYITVGYSNSTKLVPSSFGMQLTNQSSGSSVSLSFSNADGGGSSGTSEKNRGVTFLTNNGC